uniref:Uncharacterized protein n=1 Tax=Nelumbo nucifera TaxID=4432 RepID=A0A822ZDS7_NELNU|nr:TPA_asm: hypothetical protein HUJ06_016164 [Nelumbo nucifera]
MQVFFVSRDQRIGERKLFDYKRSPPLC